LNDVALDELNTAANREMDETKRVQMYYDIQQKVYDNANVIPLFRNGFAYAYDKNVKGLYVSPFSVVFYKNVIKNVK
jgi:ABC-type transport system substrate-binding protein